MRHKEDAIKNSTRLIELHRGQGISFELACKAALVTAEESQSRDSSLVQRTVNHLREIVYGPETAQLIHDKHSELQKAYGSRGFDFVEPDNYEDLTEAEYDQEYKRQKHEYEDKIFKLKLELSDLKKLVKI